ncbi:aminotransferase class V-fold PLP-dependent enzyme [Streptomyces cinnabarinus]|uniref:Aminotransferase class V-fold PLP-dependent enzyme n=1 Tax=Streptomyces cinnabarinus TaxID=67287 RepID=A0ABY7K528_9ACTN|nr:aminotransferase class V-fold PLP-dependent enzyme [Streptomyces cinnabarinus]WAZ19592.1 aminotransferase class V-fold PLP-dependent enzyme [Streptomyces cinnabarinus]
MSAARLLVDGGGTTTRVALWRDGDDTPCVQCEGPSCNPRSVGRDRALAHLDDLMRTAWQRRPADVDSLDSAWLCLSTASTRTALDDFATGLLDLPSSLLHQAADVWVTNDIGPLLVHDGHATDRVVVICGTGTGFSAVNIAKGLTARASGKDYLLADEGGGFDIGLQGLRAAVRDTDGRGPRTRLTQAVRQWRDVGQDELFDLVYGSDEPKVLVGSFAPFVLRAAEEGDACARGIVEHAAQELVAGARAVAERAELTGPHEVLLVGSNLLGEQTLLRREFEQRLAETLPEATVRPLHGTTLTAVRHMAALLPGDERLQQLLKECVPLRRFEASGAEVAVERGNSRYELAPILTPVLAEMESVLLSGEAILSPEVRRFEESFAQYIGTRHALGVNSGTDALTLALEALDIGPGDEVITVANTFHATALAITRAGATPVLVDARPDDYLMDTDALEAAVTPRTRAVVAVHLFGLSLDLAPVAEVCERYGIPLVEDCAQAVGARVDGRRVGSIGAIGCFSFHPSKNLGAAGDAGLVTTDSTELAERIRGLRYFGQRQRKVHSERGHNSKLDALQAIVLHHKLPYLDGWNAARAERAARYREALRGLPVGFQTPGEEHTYHLFQMHTDERDGLLAHLKGRGIDAVVRYPRPIHLQPAFAGLGQGEGAFPVAEHLADHLLCLPLRPDLGERETDAVVSAVREFFGRDGRRTG